MALKSKTKQAEVDEYTISDLSKLYGLTLRTLRFYEDRKLLNPVRRGAARYYSASDRAHLECILKGKRCGYSLYEIKQMIGEREAGASVKEINMRDLLTNINPLQIERQIHYLELRREEIMAALAELREVIKDRNKHNNV